MNRSRARTVGMTICFCDRLTPLSLSHAASRKLCARRTPATQCGPPGCAKGPGTHHSQPEARGPARRTHRSERGSRVDLFLVAGSVLVGALLLLLMRAVGRRRAGGGQAGRRAGGQAGGLAGARSAQQRAASSSSASSSSASSSASSSSSAQRAAAPGTRGAPGPRINLKAWTLAHGATKSWKVGFGSLAPGHGVTAAPECW